MNEKSDQLNRYLAQFDSLAIAFSGGVDSAFLLKAAHDVLGSRVLAVTVHAPVFPSREADEARAFCDTYGIRQIVCTVDPFTIEGFARNPRNRCYLCKHAMMRAILAAAEQQHIDCVAEGSNMDDQGDYRPGRQAVAELGICSPLLEARLSKAEIRELSKQMGLATWEKPSYACLASRFVYGEPITEERLAMVEQAEQLLLQLGFHQMRVRIHGKLARIEVMPQEFERLMQEEVRQQVIARFRSYGFSYVAMDLAGYRTGSMNEV